MMHKDPKEMSPLLQPANDTAVRSSVIQIAFLAYSFSCVCHLLQHLSTVFGRVSELNGFSLYVEADNCISIKIGRNIC